jgi:hypothetical protein
MKQFVIPYGNYAYSRQRRTPPSCAINEKSSVFRCLGCCVLAAPGRRPGSSLESQSNTGVSTPRILCSLGEVVVYCMWIFLSGKM